MPQSVMVGGVYVPGIYWAAYSLMFEVGQTLDEVTAAILAYRPITLFVEAGFVYFVFLAATRTDE